MLTEEQQERLDIIRHKLKFMEQKPQVVCFTSLDPLIFADASVTEAVAQAGGIALSSYDAHIPLLNPNLAILILPGIGLQQAVAQVDQMLLLPDFDATKAVTNNRLYIVDGERYFNGDNDIAVDAIELLAEIIHPKQFIFGHEGDGWIKFSL